jgi:hypothetical protein
MLCSIEAVSPETSPCGELVLLGVLIQRQLLRRRHLSHTGKW